MRITILKWVMRIVVTLGFMCPPPVVTCRVIPDNDAEVAWLKHF